MEAKSIDNAVRGNSFGNESHNNGAGRALRVGYVSLALVIGACAAPTPRVTAYQAPDQTSQQYTANRAYCEQWAREQGGTDPTQAAVQSGVATGAGGALLGAIIGGLVGGWDTAAFGAMVGGSASAVGGAIYGDEAARKNYDRLYLSCMQARPQD